MFLVVLWDKSVSQSSCIPTFNSLLYNPSKQSLIPGLFIYHSILWKALFFVPIPRNEKLACLSNDELLAHISPIMKMLYSLALVNIRPSGNPSFGPLQFVCQPMLMWVMQCSTFHQPFLHFRRLMPSPESVTPILTKKGRCWCQKSCHQHSKPVKMQAGSHKAPR